MLSYLSEQLLNKYQFNSDIFTATLDSNLNCTFIALNLYLTNSKVTLYHVYH